MPEIISKKTKEELPETPPDQLGVAITERPAEVKPRKKILILFYQEYPRKRPLRDEVVDQIKEALLDLGYAVVLLPINRSIERITNGIAQEKPDLIFNLCETFRATDKFDFNVTALLELIGIPFTGSSSGSLFLSNDKFISKKLFSFQNIPYPKFFLVPIDREPEIPKSFSFPLFVKPVHEDASIGIDVHSVVQNEEELKDKLKEIHEKIRDQALVEEYIEGREFFVSVLGRNPIEPLPVVELSFENWPKQKPKIYTYNAKMEEGSDEFKGTEPIIPQNLPLELADKMQKFALKVYQALGASDYARIDLRLDKDGNFYVLEANLNPYLAKDAETAFAAKAAGMSYRDLIGHIVELAFARAGIR
jgi:D-alanine-D-alanine ligase